MSMLRRCESPIILLGGETEEKQWAHYFILAGGSLQEELDKSWRVFLNICGDGLETNDRL
jgi:hypothetical protein